MQEIQELDRQELFDLKSINKKKQSKKTLKNDVSAAKESKEME